MNVKIEEVHARWFCIEQVRSKDRTQVKALEAGIGRSGARVQRRYQNRDTGEWMGEWETVREGGLAECIRVYNGMG